MTKRIIQFQCVSLPFYEKRNERISVYFWNFNQGDETLLIDRIVDQSFNENCLFLQDQSECESSLII